MAIIAYAAAIATAEVLIASGKIANGTAMHAGTILALLGHYLNLSRAPRSRENLRDTRLARLLPIIAVVPLMRLLSLAIPIRDMPPITWYLMSGFPILLAALLGIRFLGIAGAVAPPRSWRTQVGIGLSGLPLGVLAFLAFRPAPLTGQTDGPHLIADALILFLFVGCTEELVFRGLLQVVAVETFGVVGIVWSNVLFASLYIGTASPGYALFIFVVGLYFGWSLRQTGSLWGIMSAHGLLNVGLLLVGPHILG